jgi:hypothetical protein
MMPIIESVEDDWKQAHPSNVFAHNSLVDPDVLSELSVRSDVNFRIRFNRSGPCAIDLKQGRSTK